MPTQVEGFEDRAPDLGQRDKGESDGTRVRGGPREAGRGSGRPSGSPEPFRVSQTKLAALVDEQLELEAVVREFSAAPAGDGAVYAGYRDSDPKIRRAWERRDARRYEAAMPRAHGRKRRQRPKLGPSAPAITSFSPEERLVAEWRVALDTGDTFRAGAAVLAYVNGDYEDSVVSEGPRLSPRERALSRACVKAKLMLASPYLESWSRALQWMKRQQRFGPEFVALYQQAVRHGRERLEETPAERRARLLEEAFDRGLRPLQAHRETGIPLRTVERFYSKRREAISMQTAELITDLVRDIQTAQASLAEAADRVLALGRRFPNDPRVQQAVEDFIDVALADREIHAL